MLELNLVKYSIIASVTCRGRCEVLAESRYAMPVSKIGKSLRTAARSYVNVDITVLHAHWIRRRGNHSRQPGHLARLQVEPRPMLRALDVHAPELSVAQRELLVRAHVVEGVEVSVLGVGKAHGRGAGVDALHGVGGNLCDRSDAIPTQ